MPRHPSGNLLHRMMVACLTALVIVFCTFVISAVVPVASAGNPKLPHEAREGMEKMYSGDPDGAIAMFRGLQTSAPDHPLGFLLEAEARWWKMYCSSLEVKWGMVDTWKHPRDPSVNEYLALASKIVSLAQAQNAQHESAEMHLYAGLGFGLKARLFAILGDNRAVAHAGVDARAEFLRALKIDPQLTDAEMGIGLYNYYVDVLPGIVKVLRFFMGLPAGNKLEGIRQLETAMKGDGVVAIEARFYLAKNLRTYDRQYERAATIVEPLVGKYPRNPIFLLLLANLNLELGRNDKAGELLRRVTAQPTADSTCTERAARVSRSLLSSAK